MQSSSEIQKRSLYKGDVYMKVKRFKTPETEDKQKKGKEKPAPGSNKKEKPVQETK